MRMRPSVPFAIQVANRLRGRLRREYTGGGKLPGENALAVEMRVSRGTVRQALTILQHEGLVSRRQGLGTFAVPHVSGIPARIDFAYEFTELITASGYEAGVQTLEKGLATASAETASMLNIEQGAPMLRVRKLYLAGGRPAIYEQDLLPTGLIREDYDLAEVEQPIWHFLDCRCHRQTKYVLSEIWPWLVDADLAQLFGVPAGSPTLKFVEVFYDARNEPLVLANIYYCEPFIRFHALRKVSPVS
jgi:GntR family transcriptional regulator